MTTVNSASRDELVAVAPADRVLLLPHCLRPSESCPGMYSKQGLVCADDCSVPCIVRTLQDVALKQGYKGVCVAPGGSMVLRFVERMAPQAIVAVACQKELELGVKGVDELVRTGKISMPVIKVVPLSREGCVDTEVDAGQVIEILTS
jgi:hypothetical protein